MALRITDLSKEVLGFRLPDGLYQRILYTVGDGADIYVVFSIEQSGFGTLYIERVARVLAHPSLHSYHTSNLMRIDDEEFNMIVKELLDRKMADPKWFPMDVAQSYKD